MAVMLDAGVIVPMTMRVVIDTRIVVDMEMRGATEIEIDGGQRVKRQHQQQESGNRRAPGGHNDVLHVCASQALLPPGAHGCSWPG